LGFVRGLGGGVGIGVRGWGNEIEEGVTWEWCWWLGRDGNWLGLKKAVCDGMDRRGSDHKGKSWDGDAGNWRRERIVGKGLEFM
jgi:hypothetical protein